LAQVSITLNSGANLEGRALAQTGAVSLAGNNSTIATATVTPTATATATPVGAVEGNGLTADGVFGANHNEFNPAVESVLFYYRVSTQAHVQLSVYNVLGLRVRKLVDGEKTTGTWSVPWDGRNDQGTMVGSDVYFVLVKIAESNFVRKIAVLRER
jgi:flagellar hook assembly protein FlgD